MGSDLCDRGYFHNGSRRSNSSLVVNKKSFKSRFIRSLEKGNKIITGRIYAKVARSGIFILFVLTLLNLFIQNIYYKNEEWKSFEKFEISIKGCARKLGQIEQLRECADLARQALKNEDSAHLRKYKKNFYQRMEESLKQVGPDPLPTCMKKDDKTSTVKKGMHSVQAEKTIQKGEIPKRSMQKGGDINGKTMNGINMNGRTMNGKAMNGINVNGKTMNGINVNGKNMNGKNMNGINMNGKTMNGKAMNGKTMNGKAMNGKTMNGKTMNGINVNGKNMNGKNMNGKTMNGKTMNGKTMNGKSKKEKNGKNRIMTTAELKKKYEDVLYKKISKDDIKENFEFIDASNYENIHQKKNVLYNEDDNEELDYGCTMKDIAEEITEYDLKLKIEKLPYVVKPKDMFIIWHYVQSFGRDEYLRMNGDLLRICGEVQKEYNIADHIKRREWQEASRYMISELQKKEHNDYLEFKELVEKGPCKKGKFYEYIDKKRNSWKFMTAVMMDSWKGSLIEKLKSYSVEEA
ncbi:Plasmodium exported protein, unknown function [Plasmodium knowlesi strain H]|uniref:Plasmodium RESA N-terminal domain-containing protein n=2 Tax=Plasmodium knowlesi (strain H) TaxID=5851 RepID=A0A5K1VSF5_PLAKH|nr:Plasmodium exported protein (PHIST), unknown function [Plasmodium knowlesi strain H]CAA9990296.1 Plasmodium exported protein (PHIST), unknown function [Plasmodium knowlesi strain H]SBO19502.1 Plasmodium exported protein, unknown function [Plasmodium knowlesi strain H]SBO22830.1 Plasmodium exported protein, unknown function [Plasmodium knowlesi strain H]VVS79770.1 Plasmodium exported protein (PHIST), unknown function [Plasmodium knowlesi strain H]|eukprot:XP_002260696.1 hypothetical protein, conserved in Plasmodium species [Plasmodium knowlesi strain H]